MTKIQENLRESFIGNFPINFKFKKIRKNSNSNKLAMFSADKPRASLISNIQTAIIKFYHS